MSKLLSPLVICAALAAPGLMLAVPTLAAQPPKGQPKPTPKTPPTPVPERTASAREALVRLVPEDVALCLVVTDLRTQGDKLLQSPWVKALKESPFAKMLGDAPELMKFEAVRKQILQHLNVGWEELRDEVLGDVVLFAYRPPLPGEADKEGSLVMLEARNPELLKKMMDRLDDEQRKTGELKELKIHRHKDRDYFERVEEQGSQYYVLQGSLAVFSGQEALVKRVLERQAEPVLAPLPLVRQFAEAGVDKALANLWINPRAFDRILEAQAAELGDTPDGRSLKTFLTYWKALDGAALSMLVEKKSEVVFSVHARSELLPKAARKMVADLSKPSEVWGGLPPDSIVAVAARTDFAALLETMDQLLPADAEEGLADFLQSALGLPLTRDLLKDLSPHVGPDWGFSIAAPPHKEDFPYVLFALRLRPSPDGPNAVEAVRQATATAIQDYNRRNKDQIKLTKFKQDGVEIHCLVNDAKFPKGFRPAFANKDGYLLVASSPEALRRFGKVAAPPAGLHSPLMKIGFKQLSALLKDRRESVLGMFGKKRQLTPQAAGTQFDHMTWALDLFESAELTQRTEDGRVAWIFRMHTAEAAK